MNNKKTLTIAIIAVLAMTSAYHKDLNSLLTRSAQGQERRARTETLARQTRGVVGQDFAQAEQAEKPKTPAPKPRDVLMSASEKLKNYASVRTKISQKVTMDSHSFTAKGSYLQGQNLQLRMEFSVELGGQKGSLLQVCDGQVLWARSDLGAKEQTQITRRDVRQILDAAEKAEQRMKNPDEKLVLKASINADLAIGGLPAVLASIAKDFDLKKMSEGKIDDKEVIILEGGWTSKYREMWLGPKARDKNPPPLQPYIPDLMRISLDKTTEFPRRIEFFKQNPGQTTPTPLMVWDFTDVVLNGKVNRDDFVFIPPERPQHIDVTQIYLQRLAPPQAEPKKPAADAGEKADKADKKDAP